MKLRLCGLVLGIAAFNFLSDSPSGAAIISVEPDDFVIGTELTTATPGVTLSAQGSIDTVVVSVSGFSFFNGKNIASTGTQVFGQSPPQNVQNESEPVWNDFAFNVLRADFGVLTNFVQIDLIFRDDDVAALRAFASNGTLIDEVVGTGDGRTANAFVTAMISRATADIAYITAGGVGGEGAFLDNFSFNRIDIPEPSTLTIFGLGLAGLSAMGRRRRTICFSH